MKITVCSSMVFAKEILELRTSLQALGHEVVLPPDTENFVNNRTNERVIASNISDEMKYHYHSIEQSDAILIANFEKNGISGYIGGSTLMELAVAFYLNKRIYLLHTPPSKEQIRYVQEILLTSPTVINGDLSLIK